MNDAKAIEKFENEVEDQNESSRFEAENEDVHLLEQLDHHDGEDHGSANTASDAVLQVNSSSTPANPVATPKLTSATEAMLSGDIQHASGTFTVAGNTEGDFDLSDSSLVAPKSADLSGLHETATIAVSERSQEATLRHFSAKNTLDVSQGLWQEFLAGKLVINANGNKVDVYSSATGQSIFHLEADHTISLVGVVPQADGSVHLTL